MRIWTGAFRADWLLNIPRSSFWILRSSGSLPSHHARRGDNVSSHAYASRHLRHAWAGDRPLDWWRGHRLAALGCLPDCFSPVTRPALRISVGSRMLPARLLLVESAVGHPPFGDSAQHFWRPRRMLRPAAMQPVLRTLPVRQADRRPATAAGCGEIIPVTG